MPEPGSPEWHERKRSLLAAEANQPEAWWYLSFAGGEPDRFLGGVYLQARGFTSAIQKSHELGINPGGQVQGFGPIPAEVADAKIPENHRYRLLTKAEVEGEG